MMYRLFTLAALILGLASGCGGSESSPTGPTSSTGGTDVGGTDDADSGSPCPSGMVEKKADDGRGTVCTVQLNVESDGAVGDDTGAGGSINPTSDAAVTNTDAADECPDLEGRECTRRTCTFEAVDEPPCSFHCMNGDGSEALGIVSGPEAVERLATEYCGMTL